MTIYTRLRLVGQATSIRLVIIKFSHGSQRARSYYYLNCLFRSQEENHAEQGT